MKIKKLTIVMMSCLMVLSLTASQVHAKEAYINNPSFEKEIDNKDIQVYKAERTSKKAYDGKYSLKVGNPKPSEASEVPIWRYNYGKGSVNMVIRNVEPNTTYKVSTHFFNESGVKMSTGVLDIEGKHTTSPWQLASNIKTYPDASTDWELSEMTITTGPRTNEIYAFAYMEWTGNDLGSGVFYIDDFKIEKVESVNVSEETSIKYDVPSDGDFPLTVPAIQEFNKSGNQVYKLIENHQVFSTDKFSQSKTQYLADCMKDKGLIKDYTIKTISDIDEGEGIVLFKQDIDFKLPNQVPKDQKDAYQIDIEKDKIIVHSKDIEGIQNGSMTLLQALTQKKSLPTGSVYDYSDQLIRGLQVDTGRRYYSIQWLKEQVEQMAYYKQNKLQLRLKDNEGIRYDSKIAPELVDRKGGFWTQAEVDDLINYANKFNIEVIPEIDFPGHAEQEANGHPEWCVPDSTKALDFSKKEVRDYMKSIYKEASDFFHAKTVHIGGDEYFQSGYNNQTSKVPLEAWAQEVTGNTSATDNDAIKLFFNEVAADFLDNDVTVLLWNDNVFDLEGIVPLDKRIIVDFWAGGMYNSIKASDTANAGFKIMSSSSSNYHDLWPQQSKGKDSKLDRPLPKRVFEEFTRYHYSKQSYSYSDDEVLTQNKQNSLGQVFPIWDDAHGYVPEYILTRTLFPRYGGFALKTWGADYQKETSYQNFERLLYTLGSPKTHLFEQSTINYNNSDLDYTINTIETALKSKTSDNKNILNNIDSLKDKINEIKKDKESFKKDGFYTDTIKELIYLYENIDYVVEKGKVTVLHVDTDNKEIAASQVLEDELGLAYKTAPVEIKGYTLTKTPDNATGMYKAKEQTVTYIYKKNEDNTVKPEPNPGEKEDVLGETQTNDKDSTQVKTDDSTKVGLYVGLGLVAIIAVILIVKKKKSKE